jgi:hypothetical protein
MYSTITAKTTKKKIIFTIEFFIVNSNDNLIASAESIYIKKGNNICISLYFQS